MTAASVQTESSVDIVPPRSSRIHFFRRMLLIGSLLLPVLLIAFSAAKPFPEIRARLLGNDLVVDPQVNFLGDVVPGGRASGQFTFKNLSGTPITLLGANVGCRCTVVEDLPCQIPAGESRTISVSLKTAEKDAGKALEQSALLYFSASRPGHQLIKVTVSAKVQPQKSDSPEM